MFSMCVMCQVMHESIKVKNLIMLASMYASMCISTQQHQVAK